jgi:hypothetical protein
MEEMELSLREEMDREVENFEQMPSWLKIYEKDEELDDINFVKNKRYQSFTGGEGGKDPHNPLEDIFGDDDGDDKLDGNDDDKDNEYYVLYCYKPPDIHGKKFIPYQTGIIGIFKTLDDAEKRRYEIIRRNMSEYRGFLLLIGFSKIIKTDKDYSFPMGYNEAF